MKPDWSQRALLRLFWGLTFAAFVGCDGNGGGESAATSQLLSRSCREPVESVYEGQSAPNDWTPAMRGDVAHCAFDRVISVDEMSEAFQSSLGRAASPSASSKSPRTPPVARAASSSATVSAFPAREFRRCSAPRCVSSASKPKPSSSKRCVGFQTSLWKPQIAESLAEELVRDSPACLRSRVDQQLGWLR